MPVVQDIIRVPHTEQAAEKAARAKKRAHKLTKVTAKVMDASTKEVLDKGKSLLRTYSSVR